MLFTHFPFSFLQWMQVFLVVQVRAQEQDLEDGHYTFEPQPRSTVRQTQVVSFLPRSNPTELGSVQNFRSSSSCQSRCSSIIKLTFKLKICIWCVSCCALDTFSGFVCFMRSTKHIEQLCGYISVHSFQIYQVNLGYIPWSS